MFHVRLMLKQGKLAHVIMKLKEMQREKIIFRLSEMGLKDGGDFIGEGEGQDHLCRGSEELPCCWTSQMQNACKVQKQMVTGF